MLRVRYTKLIFFFPAVLFMVAGIRYVDYMGTKADAQKGIVRCGNGSMSPNTSTSASFCDTGHNSSSYQDRAAVQRVTLSDGLWPTVIFAGLGMTVAVTGMVLESRFRQKHQQIKEKEST